MPSAVLRQVVFSVGTNAEREKNLARAFDALAESFDELRFSSVYESHPIDDASSANYFNVVVCVSTSKTVADVQRIVHDIENQCGRDRTQKTVAMDIDLLLYGDQVGVVDNVQLPHGDIVECAYVLRPLSECLPEYQHPALGQSYQALWEQFCTQERGQLLEPIDFVWRDQVISVVPPCFII